MIQNLYCNVVFLTHQALSSFSHIMHTDNRRQTRNIRLISCVSICCRLKRQIYT